MKINIITKILAGVAVASGGIAAITVTAIKLSKKNDSITTETNETFNQDTQKEHTQQNDPSSNDADDNQAKVDENLTKNSSKTQVQDVKTTEQNENGSTQQNKESVIDNISQNTEDASIKAQDEQTEKDSTDNSNNSQTSTAVTKVIEEEKTTNTDQTQITDGLQSNAKTGNDNASTIQNENLPESTVITTKPTTDNNYQYERGTDIISFFISSVNSLSVDLKNNDDTLDDHYQCYFLESEKFDCTMSAINITGVELNHSNISEVLKSQDQKNINKAKLIENNNIYKFTVSKQKGMMHVIKDELYLSSKTSSSKQTLDILFTTINNKFDENSITKKFIFKVPTNQTLNKSENEEFKCFIQGTSNATNMQYCYLHNLSKNKTQTETSNLDSVVFEKDDNYAKLLEASNYYLIDLNESAPVTTKQIQIFKDNTNGYGYDVTPVAVYTHENENKSHIFILK